MLSVFCLPCLLSQARACILWLHIFTCILGSQLQSSEDFSLSRDPLPLLVLFAQFSSISQLCLTLCDPMDCSTPGFPVHHQLPEFTQTHVHQVRDAIQPSYPVIPFSSHLQSFPVSGSFQMSWFFTSGGQSIGVLASASVRPMNTGLISFRIDQFNLLAVQGTLKSLPQHHSSKVSILWHSAFIIVHVLCNLPCLSRPACFTLQFSSAAQSCPTLCPWP